MKLTPQNYFTPANTYLSNSKIGDYIKSPKYFYEKHIIHTREKEESDALIIGKAVDCWLTGGGRKEFERTYIGVARRGKENAEGKIELTASTYSDVVAMCESVEKTEAYKELAKFKRQVILQLDFQLSKNNPSLFEGICGTPDFLFVDKKQNKAFVVDLKTSRTADTKKYFYHALDYRYFEQQAMYQRLVKARYGVRDVESWHLVVEKDSDKIFNVKTFVLDQKIIDSVSQGVECLIEKIRNRTDWSDPKVSFKSATLLTNPASAMSESEVEWE
jgi:hypothetical protein